MVRNIFLFILSSFIAYSINAADDFKVMISGRAISSRDRVNAYDMITANRNDTIQDLINRFYEKNKICNRDGSIKLIKAHQSGFNFGELRLDQTIEAAGLFHPYQLCIGTDKIIEVTCRTLNGCTFKAEWKLFDSVIHFTRKIIDNIRGAMINGVEDDKLRNCYEGLLDGLFKKGKILRFIHERAGRLEELYTHADQVEGLMDNPILTVILEDDPDFQ